MSGRSVDVPRQALERPCVQDELVGGPCGWFEGCAYHCFRFCSGANCAPDPHPQKVKAELKTWLTTVEKAMCRQPLLDATADVLATYILGALDFPLWVRRTPEDREPVLDLPWRFLQYDDRHSSPGIDGPVDHDVFAADAQSFAQWAEQKPSIE